MKIKNLFFGMLAFAGMLAVASCSQDDFVGGETAGDYVDATFTVSTPDGIGTRAIGDGTTVNRVKCCVYDAEGVKMNLDQNLAIVGKETQYNVRLAKGQAYNVVFFAYNGDEQGNSKYYKIDDLKKIEVLGNQSSNVEERDAFTRACHVSANETMNRVEKTVVLKRPLAQLNLGIDATELADAANAGIVIEKSKIIVSNVYSFYNAYDSTVVGKDTVVVFKMNAIPTEPLKVTIDGVEKEYNYLAMNYLLVGDLGSEKTLTDVEFVWETADGNTNVPSTSFPNVTTQRNYRTNILGKLITNPATFNVVIDERFDGEKNKIYTDENGVHTAIVSTPDELVQAIEEANKPGDYVIRLKDLFTTRAAATPEFTIVQKPGVNLVIDGCNVTFDGKFFIDGARRTDGESLTFRNINFSTAADGVYFIDAYTGKFGSQYAHNVTIEGCTFKGNNTVVGAQVKQIYNIVIRNCTATGMHSLLQAQSCDDKIYIEGVNVVDCKSGVSFGNTAYPTLKNSTINAKEYGVRADGNASRGNLVIENTTVNAIKPVIVRKMTTESYNVKLDNAELVATGLYHVAFTNGSDDEAYVAPTGKFSIEGADNYNVYPRDEDKDVFLVANSEQLVEALENGKSVKFTNDIKIEPAKMSNAYGATGINVMNGQTIDGSGYTLNIKGAGGTWDSGINTTGGLIKDITVTGSFRGIFINHTSSYSEKVVLENVTIGGNGTVYTISCDQGLYQSIEATNCTFNGWTSFAKTAGEAKFINCSFGEGSGYKYCRPYSKTEFVECTFCPGYGVDKTQAEVTFTDCTWEE